MPRGDTAVRPRVVVEFARVDERRGTVGCSARTAASQRALRGSRGLPLLRERDAALPPEPITAAALSAPLPTLAQA